ncbi:hypothetical protein EDB81DRAFT_56207 [Dactylonectria macrodidyma]|uniref:Uncharacterized protein n=1 Tax=Dactylonectria macrodidyma TaxID=307937 RepID=A0A9P9ELW4_9HYPO|nr:hypothetical protein EDB81DRAFT_56207 [Dactylonectria macrodidyma]
MVPSRGSLSFPHTPSRPSLVARSLVRYNPAIVGQSLSYPIARSLTIIASAPSASCFVSCFTSLISFLVLGSWFLVLGSWLFLLQRFHRHGPHGCLSTGSCITVTTSSLSRTSFTFPTRAALLFHFFPSFFFLGGVFITVSIKTLLRRTST